MRIALITGASGQDGYYLREFLISKGYHVRCYTRGGDEDLESFIRSASWYDRIEIYNLAAQSHVGLSNTQGRYTFEANTQGPLKILETIKTFGIAHRCRVFQASSSEMYGHSEVPPPQNEGTPFNPTSMYGVSKLAAHMIMKHYRDVHGIFACSGILFNHESSRRGGEFVTQKIIQGLKSGCCIRLGNLEARRDWGHAKDYVEAMWLMLQQEHASDYVIATGTSHSVREFIEIAVKLLGKEITWESENNVGKIDGKVVVTVSKEFFRPQGTDDGVLVGDPSKLEKLGWKRKYDLKSIVEEMLFPDAEISQASSISI